MTRLRTPDLDDAVRWAARHLGDLALEGPEGVAASRRFVGGQTAADEALEDFDVRGYAAQRNEVLPAEDGEVAMRELQAYDGHIQALVTDIKLPKGPNGWEIARHARMRSADMHVLYMTGESEHEWGIHGVPRGRMLQKPFAPPRVVSELEDFQL